MKQVVCTQIEHNQVGIYDEAIQYNKFNKNIAVQECDATMFNRYSIAGNKIK